MRFSTKSYTHIEAVRVFGNLSIKWLAVHASVTIWCVPHLLVIANTSSCIQPTRGEEMHFRPFFAALSSLSLLPFAPTASAESQTGAVYVASNEATGNRILQFHRDDSGALTPVGSFNTGGLGTGGGLGNQGGLVLTDNGEWLLVVNAGSNDISVFAVDSDGDFLILTDREASGGQHPISIAAKRGLVYVLNAGGAVGATDNISGFRLSRHGQLVPIPGSTKPLSAANVGPAEIHFGSDDDELFVTEKNTNRIDVFQLGRARIDPLLS